MPSLWRAVAAQQDRFPHWLPVFLGAGVLLYFDLSFEPWPWTGVLALAVFGTPAVLCWRYDLLRRVLLPCASVALGFGAAQLATARAPPLLVDLPSHAVFLTGRISAIDTLPDARRLLLERVLIDRAEQPLPRPVRVRLRATDHADLSVGDTVRVRAMLRQNGPPLLPGGWDMQRDAFYSGLGATGYALGPAEVQARAILVGLPLWTRSLAEAAAERIRAAIPGPSGQIAVGILIGIQTGIAPADLSAFRDSGLAHLLSVSGLHLAIVIGVTMTAARALLALSEHAALHWPIRGIAALTALGVGGFYTALTGAQVPTVRCFLMACFITLGILTSRRVLSLRSLGLVAAYLLLTTPWQLLGASLQMSFAAVLALIAGFDALRPVRAKLTQWRVPLFVPALIASSLLAGSATLPFGAYHFGRVQLYYVLSNLAGVPLTSVLVMPAGMLALPLMPFGLDWLPLEVVRWGIEATLWLAYAVAALPAAAIWVPHLTPWGVALIALGMIWLAIWAGAIRWPGLLMILIGLASPWINPPPDILVSHDARLIAVRTADGVHVQKLPGGSAFVRTAWLQVWGADDAAPLPAVGEVADGAVRCTAAGCLLRPRPEASAAWLSRSAARVGDCRGIGVIVSAEPARGLCDRPWPALVDRFTVWRDGPTAIWLQTDGARVLTDRADRGVRPWVPPPPSPRPRPPPKLPVAPTEAGPD